MEDIEINPFRPEHPDFRIAQRLLDIGMSGKDARIFLERISDYPDIQEMLIAKLNR